jgi:hypothetical membrane protein
LVDIKSGWSSLPKKQVAVQKIAGLCGIIAPLVAFSFIALAISYSLSWFRWTTNALSDLAGPPPATAISAVLFNSGLIIGGLLGIIFAVGLMQVLHQRVLGFIGAFVFVLAEISLFAVGVFPETAGRIHFYVSVAFFSLFPISMFFIGAAMINAPSERVLGFATILFGMFAVMSAAPIILVRVDDVGVHELLAVFSGSVWSIIFGIKLYKQSTLRI